MLTKIGFGTLTKENGKFNGDECIIFDLAKFFAWYYLNSFLNLMKRIEIHNVMNLIKLIWIVSNYCTISFFARSSFRKEFLSFFIKRDSVSHSCKNNISYSNLKSKWRIAFLYFLMRHCLWCLKSARFLLSSFLVWNTAKLVTLKFW